MSTTGWVVLGVVVVIVLWAISVYNGLVAMRQRANQAFADIDVQLKQRHDLIPNLVETVKGYMGHERDTLEAVTKGVAKFAKEYEGTGKDIADELGKAMAAVAAAKPGFEQLTLAQKYFGKAGADLIPVIRSFDGDLPGLIRHMKDLGVTINDDAAAAADAFGDQMDLLGMQIAGVGRTIGTALMPEFTRMASDISGWIVQNKTEISNFATVTGTLFSMKQSLTLSRRVNASRPSGVVMSQASHATGLPVAGSRIPFGACAIAGEEPDAAVGLHRAVQHGTWGAAGHRRGAGSAP